MGLEIPEQLRKYCILAEDGSVIDRFRCPVPGCDYTTRLGPGAVRMHIMIKADPKVETRYCEKHQKYWMENESELTLDNIRILANLPHRSISYRKP
ncbi:MAG: hypothetical protein DRI93_06390 [Aquificota bacterium]|nr:MAG: hypothetical protein DRI93_06390 [Aquificota bacterium]HDJ22137.1 hypothetical protein [Candidatus Bathyarchaeota archaeon]